VSTFAAATAIACGGGGGDNTTETYIYNQTISLDTNFKNYKQREQRVITK
jgi:hypothetical protein